MENEKCPLCFSDKPIVEKVEATVDCHKSYLKCSNKWCLFEWVVDKTEKMKDEFRG